jgi:hypothetical protein
VRRLQHCCDLESVAYSSSHSFCNSDADSLTDTHFNADSNYSADRFTNCDADCNSYDANSDRSVPGLLAAYNFNQGSGNTVPDASGHGITGTVSGATWTTGADMGMR